MSVAETTRDLLSVYEAVCKKQRESAVRNSVLLRDVERTNRLLSQGHDRQKKLSALKAQYQLYIESVYPQWLSQYNGHIQSRANVQVQQNLGERAQQPDPTLPPLLAGKTVATPTLQVSKPEVTFVDTPTTSMVETNLLPKEAVVKTTAEQIKATPTRQVVWTEAAPTETTPTELHVVVQTETAPTKTTLTGPVVKIENTSKESVVEEKTTHPGPVSTGPVLSIHTGPATRVKTAPTRLIVTTASTGPVLSIHSGLATRVKAAPTRPIVTTASTGPVLGTESIHSGPAVKMETAELAKDRPTRPIATTEHEPIILTGTTTTSRSETTPTEPIFQTETATTAKLEVTPTEPVFKTETANTTKPETTPTEPIFLSETTPIVPETQATPTLPFVMAETTFFRQPDSLTPSLSVSADKSISLDLSLPTYSVSVEDSVEAAVDDPGPDAPSLSHKSPASPPHSQLASTPSPPHTPPTPAHTSALPQSPPVFTSSPLHPPPTPVRTSSLPPATLSPPHPPPTPVRTSSLPTHTPSPPHSFTDSPNDTTTPDRAKVIMNLLATLNDHLKAEGEHVAMGMYSEPQESDKMRARINHSNVLASNIIKSADSGLDCDTWDPSAVAVVLLHQLSLLTSSLGCPLSEALLAEEAPLIAHPLDISPSWSPVWKSLMEHVQLLHACNRPLDELAAIFTPVLVTDSTSTEKACLQVFTHLQLVLTDETEVNDDDDSSLRNGHSGDTSPSAQEMGDGLLDYTALGGGGDLSDHSSLFSEGSAVAVLERELGTVSRTERNTSIATRAAQVTPPSSDSEESSVATPPGYVPTAMENSAPFAPSQLSKNSSLRRRLGFYDDSDSELTDEAGDLLTPRKAAVEDDFDFYG